MQEQNKKWIDDVKSAITNGEILGRINEDQNAYEWSWLKVGGKPIFTFYPNDVADLQKFLSILPAHVPYRTFGAASNIMIRDNGYDGVFIKLTKGFREIVINDCEVIVGAGVLGNLLVQTALMKNLGGIAFLATIPGTIGGFIKMNAGAHGREIQNVVKWVEYLDSSGTLHRISNQECVFEYRRSRFLDSDIIVRACLSCQKIDYSQENEYISHLIDYRKKTQPTSGKMAGCFFKNPKSEDDQTPARKAWELIRSAENRNPVFSNFENIYISEIHANFIMNNGKATASEIEKFIIALQQDILKNEGVELQTEIEIIGK